MFVYLLSGALKKSCEQMECTTEMWKPETMAIKIFRSEEELVIIDNHGTLWLKVSLSSVINPIWNLHVSQAPPPFLKNEDKKLMQIIAIKI